MPWLLARSEAWCRKSPRALASCTKPGNLSFHFVPIARKLDLTGVPVGGEFARADHVEDETVTLNRVLSKAQAATGLRMVILDASRNNPFRMASPDARAPSAAACRGSSPVVAC
jgi:hypothetical protein